MSEQILDSGSRREFESGAVRDVAEGKGRCDLLPLDVVHMLADTCGTLEYIDAYVRKGSTDSLCEAIWAFVRHCKGGDMYTTMLEVSAHYESGCHKYGDRNWEKGIPLHCYIDSGVRHYLKYLRGDMDEPHDRAFVWNLMCAIWTHHHIPEMIDLPFRAGGGA
ncbi:MAG TPA: DUF5664 domain-containing protein [Smithellaceae bacterium]|nr:DUF5664 domain-containing protein [Smithellaceae bacterium]